MTQWAARETGRARGASRGALAVLVFAFAAVGGLPARAAAVQQEATPHSSARLIAEDASIRPGEPFTVGLHITLDPGWHTYWINAGDAGTGTLIDWRLPPGFSADSLRYPRPERIPYPPLLNYGYEDEVVLLAEVTPPADLTTGETARLEATIDFLVCEDVCIPAHTTVALELPVREAAPEAAETASLIERYRAELPIESEAWRVRAARTDSGFVLAASPPEGWEGDLAGAYFYPADPTTLTHTPEQAAGIAGDELRLRLPQSAYLPDEPEVLEGILTLAEGAAFDDRGSRALEVSAPVERDVAWAADPGTPLAAAAAQGGGAAARAGAAASLSLLVALAFAFLGGVILNLMPCVFPILSLKALGFVSRGGDRAGMRRDGLAFAAGVVSTFLLVAAILIAVRAAGAEVGWGYQLQSPLIVALLAALMFGLGLWLAGVVELGASLTRLGGIGAGGAASGGSAGGTGSAFLTGVLATVVATPCTAPFMGAAIGAALIRPTAEALAIFAGLGIGMATPYVMLAFWPALARRLPRPGRWMETFKQVLAFPMFAVAIWLVWVFGLQVGVGGAARLLFALLLVAMAAWLVGRWPATVASGRLRVVTRGLALVALLAAVLTGGAAVAGAEPLPSGPAGAAGAAGTGGVDGDGVMVWEPFSQDAIGAYRAEGRPVFVDFTAAWCISCQVNERVALETSAVRQAFADYDVALLKADWTRRDPAITRALADFGRVGVPLYVLYPADPAAEPRVLPELLTQSIVLDALSEVAGPNPPRTQAGPRFDD